MNSQTRIVTSAADSCGNPQPTGSMGHLPSRDHKGAEYKESFMSRSHSLLLAACGGVVAVVLAGASAVQAAPVNFSDTFSGPTGSSASYGGTPDTIGNGWVIPSSSQSSTWQITDTPFSGGALDAQQIGTFGNNVPAPMVNPGAETPATGFNISVDVATPVAAMTGDYPGLVFNYQNANNYDYVRIITATDGQIQMFTVVSGTTSYLSNSSGTLASSLAVNTMYQFTATANGAGSFSFSLSTTGSSPTTLMTASATNSQFISGIAGIGESGNDYYSNFSDTFTPVPEPATLGLVMAGGLGLLLLKRRQA